MLEYKIEQKKQLVTENVIHTFSQVLSWFLNTAVSFLASFLKAMIDAIKLFLRF